MEISLLKQIIIENQRLLFETNGLIDRELREDYNSLIKTKHIIAITGVRRCGKSTLMSLIARFLLKKEVKKENILYINFESEHFIDFTHRDYQKILDAYYELYPGVKGRVYLFLDEIQNVPDWEKWLNRLYELRKYKIFVTGSNATMLSSESATALVGRCYKVELFPFSFKEYLRYRKITINKEKDIYITEMRALIKNEFNKYLLTGGFPEIIDEGHLPLIHELYQNILYRDVIVRHGIKGIKPFRELAYYLLSNAASPITYNSLQKLFPELKSVNTIKNYVQYLEDAYLMFTIPVYSASLKVQMRNPVKLYCIDNALLNKISFRISTNYSKLYENLVFLHLKRSGVDIYYYKVNGEVDFICTDKDRIKGIIQVSYDVSDKKTREREEEALFRVMEILGSKKGVIITSEYEKIEKKGKMTIEYIPFYRWLL
jgi:hypothetical protein